jgi:protocatechuate 3,4-dioxygenase beta subunit
MQHISTSVTRRRFLYTTGLAASFLTVRGAFAEQLARETAWATEGPFYPPKLPLDTDNDLIIVNDSITPAIGTITHVSGRLLDSNGNPIRNAEVEIWQADTTQTYLAERDRKTKYDANFQGFGRFLTGSTGDYYFRTIRPVPYPGRPAPHIHFKIKRKGSDPWTTQLFIKGYPGNAQDGVYNGVGDEKAKATVTMDFLPLKESPIGELAAKFDITPGAAHAEDHHGPGGGPGGPPPGGEGFPPGGPPPPPQ